MTLASPDAIVAALRSAGLVVVERPGWRTRGNGRPFAPIGQAWHHDAGAESMTDLAAVELMERGRPDLSPPLCNGTIGNGGTVYLVAYGQANHAGWNDGAQLARIAAGLPPFARPGTDTEVGNGRLWGWECRNAGDGLDPWDQLDAMERAGAALGAACGWPPSANIAHRELTRRKIDPAGFDMAAFRADIARYQTGPPTVTLTEITAAVRELIGESTGARTVDADGAPAGEARSDVWRWARESVTILRKLDKTPPAVVTLTAAQLDQLAGSVVRQLGPPLAGAVADLLAKRLAE